MKKRPLEKEIEEVEEGSKEESSSDFDNMQFTPTPTKKRPRSSSKASEQETLFVSICERMDIVEANLTSRLSRGEGKAYPAGGVLK